MTLSIGMLISSPTPFKTLATSAPASQDPRWGGSLKSFNLKLISANFGELRDRLSMFTTATPKTLTTSLTSTLRRTGRSTPTTTLIHPHMCRRPVLTTAEVSTPTLS